MARRGAKLGQSVLDLDIDDSKFHSKMSGAYKAAQSFTDQTGKSLVNAGRAMSGVGESMTRNVTLPIVAAGASVGKLAFDFDETMSQIVALTSVSSDEMAGFREEILAMGPAVGKGPQELAEAFYFIASAGFEGAEAMEILRSTAQAASAGLGDTATVSKVIGSAVNAYGVEASHAAVFTDQLVAAIGEGSAEAPEFAGALGNVIGSAAQIGASFSDVTGAIAAMTNVGIGAEEAVTSLNQVFVSLFKPTAGAAEALEEMGLSAAGLRQMIADEGLMPTLGLLAERFDGNAEATAAVFGNVRALRGVLALTGPQMDETAALLDRVADSAGATGEAFATVAESDSFKLRQAMAELETTGVQLGSDVLPILVEVMGELAGMARGLSKWWGTLDDDTKDLVIRSLAFLAVAGPVLVIVGKLTTGVGQLFRAVAFLSGAKGIPRLVGAVGKLNTAMGGLLGPIGLAAAALAALTVIGENVFKALNPDEYDFNQLASKVGKSRVAIEGEVNQLAQELGRSSDEIKAEMADLLERGFNWDRAVEMLRTGTTDVADALEQSGRDWEAYQEQITGAAESGAEDASGAIEDMPPDVVAALQAAGIPIGTAADDTFGEVDQAAADARAAAIEHMRSMLTGITNLFENDETLRDSWQALIDRMDDPYTEAERKADIFSQTAIDNILAAIESGDPKIAADTATLVENMLTQIELMEPGALASGEAVPPALQDGMDAGMSALITWIEQNVTGAALSSLSLEEAEEIGLGGIWKYQQGMLRNERLASAAADRVARGALWMLENQDWYGAGAAIPGSVAMGIDDNAWTAISSMYGMGQSMKEAMPFSEPKDPRSPFRGITGWGGNIVDTIAADVYRNLDVGRGAMHALADAMRLDWAGIDAAAIPDIRAPAIASLPVAASGVTSYSGETGTGLTQIYQLHVEGKPIVVGSAEEVLAEWERMQRLSDREVIGG
jgi:TP901 family phage tail tape measure protein